MRFDSRYATYKLVESMAQKEGLLSTLDQPGEEEEAEN